MVMCIHEHASLQEVGHAAAASRAEVCCAVQNTLADVPTTATGGHQHHTLSDKTNGSSTW